MAFIPRPHEIYKHFKGNLYQITAIATHTETEETLVIYQALYGDFKTYARPLDMFVSEVDREKYPDAGQRFRFELQGDNEERRKRRAMEQDAQKQLPVKETVPGEGRSEKEGPEKEELGKEYGEVYLDPQVLEFLDADSYETRLNILAGIQHRVTDDMITTMAVACDIEVPEGDTEERFTSLRNCLLTLEKYECNRLR